MKIRLLVTGKTEEEYLRTGIKDYEKRIRRYVPFEITEMAALKSISKLPLAEQKAREGEMILKQIQPGEIIVLLDEHGKEMTSASFATFLNQRFISGNKTMVFIVGGPYGFDEPVRKSAHHILSLSKMTFSHQMVRLFFTEQLYRALTILRGESYHHE
jgi:23S rRNA (pseudouridine1915-N3)-methyltransferase